MIYVFCMHVLGRGLIFGPHLVCTESLLLALQSGITPDGTQEIICSAGY